MRTYRNLKCVLDSHLEQSSDLWNPVPWKRRSALQNVAHLSLGAVQRFCYLELRDLLFCEHLAKAFTHHPVAGSLGSALIRHHISFNGTTGPVELE